MDRLRGNILGIDNDWYGLAKKKEGGLILVVVVVVEEEYEWGG